MPRIDGYNGAIEVAEATGRTLSKYEDPIEGARDGLSVREAREVANADPGLIYIDASPEEIAQYAADL